MDFNILSTAQQHLQMTNIYKQEEKYISNSLYMQVYPVKSTKSVHTQI